MRLSHIKKILYNFFIHMTKFKERRRKNMTFTYEAVEDEIAEEIIYKNSNSDTNNNIKQ